MRSCSMNIPYPFLYMRYGILPQMYNHITNQWGDKPHDIPFDVRKSASGTFAKEYLIQWLKDNPDTDVDVLQHFSIILLLFSIQRPRKSLWTGLVTALRCLSRRC